MIKRTEWKREQLDENSWRTQVINGWLVYTQFMNGKHLLNVTCTFVPDTYCEWQIIDPKLAEIHAIKTKVPECLL